MQRDSLSYRFEQLVERILTAQGFIVSYEPASAQIDFLATNASDTFAAEVKYYRNHKPDITLLESAIAKLQQQVALLPTRATGMLIISADLPGDVANRMAIQYGVAIIELWHLRTLASPYPELLDELALFSDHSASPEASGNRMTRRDSGTWTTTSHRYSDTPSQARSATPSPPPPPPSGRTLVAKPDPISAELLKELSDLEPGRDAWRPYEELCGRILKHLFYNDLSGWRTQQRTSEDLDRFDLVCRINREDGFWGFLLRDIGSRFILFEFKNYTDEIGQGQILTTEKYLLEKGLRLACIIFSRRGANDNALKAMRGAMRESGKLMIVLDDEKVRTLLTKRQNGDEPADYLFELADDFLLELSR